jgi:hypothetical protein
MPDPVVPSAVYFNLEALRPAALELGLRDEVESALQDVGPVRLPCKAIRGVTSRTSSLPPPRGLVVAAVPGLEAGAAPRLTLTHAASGLALLSQFVDPVDDSARNAFARKYLPTGDAMTPIQRRLTLLHLRRAYDVPLSAAGLRLLSEVGRQVGTLADWTLLQPVAGEEATRVMVDVYERAWPVLRPLAEADDRACYRAAVEKFGQGRARDRFPWLVGVLWDRPRATGSR